MSYLFEIALIVILIVLNGIFAMSEFAIVSAKKVRLQQRAEKGDTGSAAALALAEQPTTFLSTIQIGITLVGILAGAFGGATVAAGIVPFFQEVPALAPYSQVLSITLVVLAITYLTLIFGELVPKRIALNKTEEIASVVARPMHILSVVATPVVFVLTCSTEAVLKVMGIRDSAEPPVTEEEIKIMLEEGAEAGVFERSELSMVEGIFDLDDRRVESLMTPRPHVVALDLDDSDAENVKTMIQSGRSRFPVYEGDQENIIGMVSVKNVLAKMEEGTSPAIRAAMTEPFFVPEGLQVLKLIESFKQTGLNIALVTDEYGSVQGLVTLHDVLEAIVGDVRTLRERAEVPVVVREDGSWLIDGSTAIENVKDVLSVEVFPGEEEGRYHSIAGLIMYVLERIPRTGDYIELDDLRYEVVDMDGNRVDKVLVTPLPPDPAPTA
ncbi:putative hemolysin [Methanofollis sp. W23]|uniref:hemolysin family protein n=1 Tax=Methanofollis sp. W23 TaxID=2817849 RepID=UPI001AE9EC11|nr:hemolysin family protein [Methanofollis sp. W23]MBP2147167.1 putative hemolysin [Methanofollis sp. W23]